MKFLISIFASLFFALPAMAVDISMGSNGSLIFEPAEVSISAGEIIRFVDGEGPPHNIIVEGRADLSREALMFNPGDSQDIKFADAGDYDFFCGHHHGAGMAGTIHVSQ